MASRQRRWQLKMMTMGRCARCGKPVEPWMAGSVQYCLVCTYKTRKKSRVSRENGVGTIADRRAAIARYMDWPGDIPEPKSKELEERIIAAYELCVKSRNQVMMSMPDNSVRPSPITPETFIKHAAKLLRIDPTFKDKLNAKAPKQDIIETTRPGQHSKTKNAVISG